MKRRRKIGLRATDKHSGGEIEYQNMDSRSIGNNKEEKQKNKIESDIKNLNHSSYTANKPQKVERQEKVANSTATIPEVFDSSKYNAATEMKDAANMREGEHLKEVLMSVDKEEPLIPENSVSKNMDNSQVPQPEPSLSSTAEIVSNDVNPQSLEERAAMLRGSKELLDKDLQDNRNVIQQDMEHKEKEDEKQKEINKDYLQAAFTWPNLINTWSDLYVESAKNMATITDYWINLFSKPWLGGYKKEDKK